MTLDVRRMRDSEREAMLEMHMQAFRLPPYREARVRATPLEEGWVVEDAGRLVGGLRAECLAQYFGGRPVPSAAVSAVKVAPEARGRGIGGLLLRQVLDELRQEGEFLSFLYPSSIGFYRRVGYEVAFGHSRYGLSLHQLPREGSLVAEPWEDGELEEVKDCYERVARASTGLVARSADWWDERILSSRQGERVYRYAVRTGGKLTGYVVYTHEAASADLPYAFALSCRDLVWEDAESASSLLAFASANAGLGVELEWPGSPLDPLLTSLTGQLPRAISSLPGMVRLIDVRGALEARGYPDDVEATVELEVSDPCIPANEGTVRLTVAGGSGHVESVSSAAARVGVDALAALYTGWLPAGSLARLGRIQDARPETLRTLEKLFLGPTPWVVAVF